MDFAIWQEGEKMDDLISRQAAFDAMVKIPTLNRIDVMKTLESLPSVKPEQKRAKWVNHVFEGMMGFRPETNMCSHCLYISA